MRAGFGKVTTYPFPFASVVLSVTGGGVKRDADPPTTNCMPYHPRTANGPPFRISNYFAR